MNKIRKYGRIFLDKEGSKVEQEAWLNIDVDEIYLETSYGIYTKGFWKTIIGSFNGLNKATLLNCYATSGSSGGGGSWRKIRTTSIFKNIHIESYEGAKFREVVLSCPSLTNWLIPFDGIEIIDKHNFKTPDDVEILKVLLDEIEISIGSGYGYSHNFQKLTIENNSAIHIKSDEGIGIDKLFDIIRDIKKFFLFLINKNIEFKDYLLTSTADERCELINIEHELDESRFSMVFDIRFNDLKSDIQVMFQNWMKNSKLDLIFDLVLERCYNTELSPQGFFFSMCTAIENLTNNLITIVDDEKTKENIDKRKKILNLIDDKSLRNWFGSKSVHWKKRDFRNKLSYFDESLGLISESVFKFDLNELKSRIVETRNSIAHEGIYDIHFSTIELFLVGKLLESNVKVELLKILGFNEKGIDILRMRANEVLKSLAKMNGYAP